jgi:hypothetical protein
MREETHLPQDEAMSRGGWMSLDGVKLRYPHPWRHDADAPASANFVKQVFAEFQCLKRLVQFSLRGLPRPPVAVINVMQRQVGRAHLSTNERAVGGIDLQQVAPTLQTHACQVACLAWSTTPTPS